MEVVPRCITETRCALDRDPGGCLKRRGLCGVPSHLIFLEGDSSLALYFLTTGGLIGVGPPHAPERTAVLNAQVPATPRDGAYNGHDAEGEKYPVHPLQEAKRAIGILLRRSDEPAVQ
jgi:hypothetical protein